MSSEVELIRDACRIVTTLLVEDMINVLEKRQRRKSKGRVWVRKWIARRDVVGASGRLLTELSTEDSESYRNHWRMTEANFHFLLERVTPMIRKQNTRMRDALPPKLKLEITLRYLASGDSFASLQYLYRVPKCSISKFLPDVCDAIYSALTDYIKVPHTQEEWKEIIQGFSARWNFPNCAGALDGKHIVIRSPFHSGSNFYNYKGTFSIILLALVDDQYCFKYINVGANGRASDGGVFSKSTLKTAIENNSLGIPQNAVFVADDAFPLKEYLLKPYSHHGPLTLKEKVFNYRLSRARRVVENAFGILVSRFRVFEKPIALCPEKVDGIVKATCALHNFLRVTSTTYIHRGCVDKEKFESGTILEGSWRQNMQNSGLADLNMLNETHNYSRKAAEVRNNFSDWFVGDGAVPWQMKMIRT